MDEVLEIKNLFVEPVNTSLYVPPIVWKGDSIGHIGVNDLFFLVLEGECYLNVDNESYIIKPGQMAYLPKGKMRTYTHSSNTFKMYELSFIATTEGKNIMEVLGLMDSDFVVKVSDFEKVCQLFENSHKVELFKSAPYIVSCCANIISLISIYTHEREKLKTNNAKIFKPVLDYMSENIDKTIKTEEFASLIHMQTTYFIKKFKLQFSVPPITYFNRLKVYKAMSLLASTDLSIDKIALKVGMSDASYFARIFKSHTKITPTKYRSEFKKYI